MVSGDVAGGNGSTEDVAVGAPGGEIGEIDEAEAERVAAAELADKAEAEMVAAARAVDASLAQAAAVEVAEAPTGLDVDDPVVDDDDEEEEEGELLDGGGDATLHSGAVPLGEWSVVERRCRRRLGRIEAKLAVMTAEMLRQARAFALSEEAPSGVLQRLGFLFEADGKPQQLPVELKLRVGDGAWSTLPPAVIGNAEWNSPFSLEPRPRMGPLHPLAVPSANHHPTVDASAAPPAATRTNSTDPPPPPPPPARSVLLATVPEDGDLAAVAWQAHALGACAILFEADSELTRPMSYPASSEAPPLPAAMIPQSTARDLRWAIIDGQAPWASLRIADMNLTEDVSGGGGGVDEGAMAQVVALEDGLDTSLALALTALHEKRDQLTRALRFASSVREGMLEGSEDLVCPVCLDSDVSAHAVLPECFHTLCAGCLQTTTAGGSSFRCPLCRVQAL